MARKRVMRRLQFLRFRFEHYAVPRATIDDLLVIARALHDRADPSAGSVERAAAARLPAVCDEIDEVRRQNKVVAQERTRPDRSLRTRVVQLASSVRNTARMQQRSASGERAEVLAKIMVVLTVIARPAQLANPDLCLRVAELQRTLARGRALRAAMHEYIPAQLIDELFRARDALFAFLTRTDTSAPAVALPYFVELLRTRMAEYVFSVLGTTDVLDLPSRARAARLLRPLRELTQDLKKDRSRRRLARAKKAAKAAATTDAPAKAPAAPTKLRKARKPRPR